MIKAIDMSIFEGLWGKAMGAAKGANPVGSLLTLGFGLFDLKIPGELGGLFGLNSAKAGASADTGDGRVEGAAAGAGSEGGAASRAKLKAYGSGVLFTSPTGINKKATASSAKLR